MKRIILLLSIPFLVLSCSYEWLPHYTTFEEATAHITEKYGEPALVRDTVFYDDGTVRNRVAYWDINPPEIVQEEITFVFSINNEYTYIKENEYITYFVEAWNQTSSERSIVLKYNQYGWGILTGKRSATKYIE